MISAWKPAGKAHDGDWLLLVLRLGHDVCKRVKFIKTSSAYCSQFRRTCCVIRVSCIVCCKYTLWVQEPYFSSCNAENLDFLCYGDQIPIVHDVPSSSDAHICSHDLVCKVIFYLSVYYCQFIQQLFFLLGTNTYIVGSPSVLITPSALLTCMIIVP